MRCKSLLGAVPAVALAGAILAAPAHAVDRNGRYAVRGAGAQTCEQLTAYMTSTDEREKREAILIYDAWFAGYTSHVNRVAQDTYDIAPIVNSVDMLNVLIQQCARNPRALVESIASGVLAALSKSKVETESKLSTVGEGDERREYREATILRAQQKLVALKLLGDKPDGKYGPKTAAAVGKFQQSQNLPRTGHLDSKTLLALLLK